MWPLTRVVCVWYVRVVRAVPILLYGVGGRGRRGWRMAVNRCMFPPAVRYIREVSQGAVKTSSTTNSDSLTAQEYNKIIDIRTCCHTRI
jgi:hypothetical protein